MPAEVGNNVVATFSAIGTVFSVSVAVVTYFTSRGKAEGTSQAEMASLKTKSDAHDAAITALRSSVDQLNQAVAVLKDLAARAETDGRIQNEKLDKLLDGQAEMRGRILGGGK